MPPQSPTSFKPCQYSSFTRKVAPFKYEPLNLHTDSLRLIRVEGFGTDGRVRCSLKHASISTAQYTAISYAWGSEDGARSIYLNGQRLTIRANIYNFLRRVARSVVNDATGVGQMSSSSASTTTESSSSKRTRYFPPMSLLRSTSWDPRACLWCNHFPCSCTGNCEPLSRFSDMFESRYQTRSSAIDLGITKVALDWFWIDAICLDQSNILERNHQVQQMFQIYSSATAVLAWLGEADMAIETWLSQSCFMRADSCIEHRLLCHAMHTESVRAFCNLSYWSRAWIIQEVLVAETLILVYDDFVIPWNNSALGLYFLPVQTSEETPMRDVALVLRQERGLELQGWLGLLRHLRSTDPRDKIYSLRYLIQDGQGFKVDYRESLLSLAVRTALYFGGSYTNFDRIVEWLGVKRTLHPPDRHAFRLKDKARFGDMIANVENAGGISLRIKAQDRLDLAPADRRFGFMKGPCRCPFCGHAFSTSLVDSCMLRRATKVGSNSVVCCGTLSNRPIHFFYDLKLDLWLGPFGYDLQVDDKLLAGIGSNRELTSHWDLPIPWPTARPPAEECMPSYSATPHAYWTPHVTRISAFQRST